MILLWWAVKRNGKSSKTSYIQALIPSCLPNQSRSTKPKSLGWIRIWNLFLWRGKRRSVYMALTQLNLNLQREILWVKDPAPKRRKPKKVVGWNPQRLCGLKTCHSDLASQINIEGFSELPFKEQANAISAALLKPLGEYKQPAPLERVPLESDSPVILRVTEQRVQRALDVLNPRKACGPDRTPSWLLKECCDLVAYPITEILNASYAGQRLPTIWKMADVTPLPKKKPVVDIQKELRPISLTPCISKVAKSSSWMVPWNLRSWTSSMTTSTKPSQIPQLLWR